MWCDRPPLLLWFVSPGPQRFLTYWSDNKIYGIELPLYENGPPIFLPPSPPTLVITYRDLLGGGFLKSKDFLTVFILNVLFLNKLYLNPNTPRDFRRLSWAQ